MTRHATHIALVLVALALGAAATAIGFLATQDTSPQYVKPVPVVGSAVDPQGTTTLYCRDDAGAVFTC